MSAGWNSISLEQQSIFLQQSRLSSLPPMEAMNAAQWSILAGITCQETVGSLKTRYAVGDSPADPVPPPPRTEVADWSNVMMMVASLQMELVELQVDASSEKILCDGQQSEFKHEERASELRDRLDELSKAASSGLFGKIFGWIGAALGVVAGFVATLATGGAAAPLLAVATVSLGMMILEETGAMDEIVGFIAEHPMVLSLISPALGAILTGLVKGGVLDEDAARMFVSITFSVVMVAASITAAIMSGGASTASSFSFISSKTADLLKWMGLGVQVVDATVQTAKAGSDIATSVFDAEAAMSQAEVQDNKAALTRLQALLAEESDRLQELLAMINEGVKSVSQIINDIQSSNRQVISHIGM